MRTFNEMRDDFRTVRDLIETCVDVETGEITDAEKLETLTNSLGELEMEFDSKMDAIARYIKILEANIKERKETISYLGQWNKHDDDTILRLKQVLVHQTNGEKYETSQFKFNRIKLNENALKIYDTRAIGEEYRKEQISKVPDTEAIKKALLAGKDVAGAKLYNYYSISINAGGKK